MAASKLPYPRARNDPFTGKDMFIDAVLPRNMPPMGSNVTVTLGIGVGVGVGHAAVDDEEEGLGADEEEGLGAVEEEGLGALEEDGLGAVNAHQSQFAVTVILFVMGVSIQNQPHEPLRHPIKL